MLFQRQEFAASSPFFFFVNHHEELSRHVRQGRKEFMRQFPTLAVPKGQKLLPNPADPATFAQSKLDLAERVRHAVV